MEYLKERWREMYWGQRIMLLLQPVLFVLALAAYFTIGQQLMVDALRYERQGDAAVYSGREDHRKIKYVVSPGPVVEFWLDGELRDTYTVAWDSTAISQSDRVELYGRENFTGVEIRRGDEVWFRGARLNQWPYFLQDEDGNDRSVTITAVLEGVRPVPEPTPSEIISFAQGPETAPRGYFGVVLLGLAFSVVCVIWLLFEDQLYQWQMSFRMRDPQCAEPSDWEIMNRWAGWIAFTCMAAVMYALGTGLIYVPFS